MAPAQNDRGNSLEKQGRTGVNQIAALPDRPVLVLKGVETFEAVEEVEVVVVGVVDEDKVLLEMS